MDTLYTAPPTLAAAESISGLTKLSSDLISGTVSDPAGVSTMLIKDGTTVLGNATITGANWSYTASSLADGSHSFTAVATDDAVKVRLTHFKQCDAEIGQHGGGCFKQRSGMAIIHALAFLVRNSRPVGAHRINDGLYRLSVLTAAIVHWNTVYLGPARLGAHRAHRRLCLDQR